MEYPWIEFEDVRAAIASIQDAPDERGALVHAFNGITQLMLTVLSEIRDLREKFDA